jgi:hypothetical protein
MQFALHSCDILRIDPLVEGLVIAKCPYEIAHTLTTTNADELDLEALIPIHLRVPMIMSKMSLSSTSVYMALHPPVTDLNVCTILSPFSPSKRRVHIIKKSALVVIEHFMRVNEAR